MSEQYLPNAIDDLAAQAKKHEDAGKFQEAALDYKTLLTIEEICGFPKPVIEFEQENVVRCLTKAMMEKTKPYIEAFAAGGGSQEATEVRGVNTSGELRVKPSDTTRLIDIEKEWQQKTANQDRATVLLDTSSSMDLGSTKMESARQSLNLEHTNIIEPGSTRLIDTEKEWQEKTTKTNVQKPIIFTEFPEIYPSKGCP